MNIFVLDRDPVQAARDMCNKHVVKMILESAQLLCTALALRGIPKENLPYKSTHAKHPCTLWLVENDDNMAWLWLHALELCSEYTRRFHKTHKTEACLNSIRKYIPVGDWRAVNDFAKAMPVEWKHLDAVTAYRCYYIAEKSRFAKWWPRSAPPEWWPFEEERDPVLLMTDEEYFNAF